MSRELKEDFVHFPAVFPEEGRLYLGEKTVLDNYYNQEFELRAYQRGAESRGTTKARGGCAKSLHVSIFFDGTNNNQLADTQADPSHPTNPARLFHAALNKTSEGFFSYYIPGVGTPFPEIGELEYTTLGMSSGAGGENRINWGLLRIIDVLCLTLVGDELNLTVARSCLREMATPYIDFRPGSPSRRNAFKKLLETLRPCLEKSQPKYPAIKLFVYGFSRGAAEARAFVNWLSEMFDTPPGAEKPEQALLGIRVSVEFLGIMDTVASVGTTDMGLFVDGHASWADDTQKLPDAERFPNWIKVCKHFVAAHEQRLSFPVDSARYKDGRYPPYATEVLYPGMHSDVGGGYPRGDQGKALAGAEHVLSQIVLHDMYAAAFKAGAPLTVLRKCLPEWLREKHDYRSMPGNAIREFDISPELVRRFNAWRHTLGLDEETLNQTVEFGEAIDSGQTLEAAMANQMHWLTAWRIDRYARGKYAQLPFYLNATEKDAATQAMERQARKKLQASARADNETKLAGASTPAEHVGIPVPADYEPTVDKTQLSQAAGEFKADYRFSPSRRPHNGVMHAKLLPGLEAISDVYLLLRVDQALERRAIIKHAAPIATKLFPQHIGPHYRVSDDPTLAAIVALFDDQVHDSRAWFLHDLLKAREPWGGYLQHRVIFFDTISNKRLRLFAVGGHPVGIAPSVHPREYVLHYYGPRDYGLPEYEVADAATGEVLPFVGGAPDNLEYSYAFGDTVKRLRSERLAAEQDLRIATLIADMEAEGVQMVPAKGAKA
ncbi:phospholipase effector Tle1 domain-containing protein [Pseudomonas sp. NPDC007930]|uniref:T6SS phospholipase effector Tle1-like catalytic domain-containing protein n=1 Tax=Pseudomonas sp. NPDC007930 TaxID=3364417 RepID=UPI0036E9D24F